jgi:hypothetical protein
MKWLGWGVVVFILTTVLSMPAGALVTEPTTTVKTASPIVITAYSYKGGELRYVQLYNNTSTLIDVSGWQIVTIPKTMPGTNHLRATLHGLIEPGKHAIAALPDVIDRPVYVLDTTIEEYTVSIGSVQLKAPGGSAYNDETVVVAATTSQTPREMEDLASVFHARRDVSATTGNYLSGFSYKLPTEPLKNDWLYVPMDQAEVKIVELYSAFKKCHPFESSTLCSDYVKIFNPGVEAIDLSAYRIRTGHYNQTISSSNTKQLAGSVAAGSYVAIPLTLSTTGTWTWLEDRHGITKYHSTIVEFPSIGGHTGMSWSYDESNASWRWSDTPSPSGPNALVPLPVVNMCDSLRIAEVAANTSDDDQYIEIMNVGSEAVDLTGCMLQTNRSETAAYVFPSESLTPGGYSTVYVRDTPLTLTKTTKGSVYIVASDGITEVDSLTYDDLKKGTAYALFGRDWLQTYQPTPGAANALLKYLPCEEGSTRNELTGLCNKLPVAASSIDCGPGKYRNIETNRCRNVATEAQITPCKSNQYRSAETNRCRNILSTASMLTPCASHQTRNPETNRCRNSSSGSSLVPCSAGQERNPETNRCRKVAAGGVADFPVDVVAQSSEATLGWWAFGGVGVLAVGYAGWEWRREVTIFIRSLKLFGVGRS